MRRNIVILLVIIVTMVPFTASCEAGDLPALVNWAKLWAMVNDITDADGNVNFGAATRFAAGEAFGFGTTGDDEADAAIDNARTLNKIREAEDSASTGRDNLSDVYVDVTKDVIPHYDKAVDLRPNDWAYRNERGVAQLMRHDIKTPANIADGDFKKAAELADTSKRKGEYVKMLEHRAQMMEKIAARDSEEGLMSSKSLLEEQVATYIDLYEETNDNKYQLLRGQVETTLQSGEYWTYESVNRS